MDISMIIGLAIAGSIVMLSGNKSNGKKPPAPKPSSTEFVVRVGNGDIAVIPKP